MRSGLDILFLTQWFDPEPAFMGVDFTTELQSRGHRVQVLTGFPNYPGGRLYEGYRLSPIRRELVGDTPVIRVALYPSHDRSAWKRILNYASFASSAATLGVVSTRRPDVILAYHPPGTIGLPAVALAQYHRSPFVYHILDMWPDALKATGMFTSRAGLGAVGTMMNLVYRRSAALVVSTHGFKRTLIERGVPERKVHTVYNWAPDEIAGGAPQTTHAAADTDTFDIIFAGNMGAAQGLAAVLDAAKLVESIAPDVRFIFVGAGVEKPALEQAAMKQRLSNVVFLPPVPRASVGDILLSSDALLVHLRDDDLFRITIPSKVQAYLAAGRPILGGVRGEAARLIRAARAGIVCLPDNPRSIAEAALRLRQFDPSTRRKMGLNGRSFFERHLSLKAGVTNIERVLVDAAERGTRDPQPAPRWDRGTFGR